MLIEIIKIKNYKAFKFAEISNIPKMCVVVGANGSGKSTLFDIFGFLKDAMTENITTALNKRGGFKENYYKREIYRNIWLKRIRKIN